MECRWKEFLLANSGKFSPSLIYVLQQSHEGQTVKPKLIWYDLTLARPPCPRTKGGCMRLQFSQTHLQTTSRGLGWKRNIFPYKLLIITNQKSQLLRRKGMFSFYPNENQFQDFGPLKFKRLQTQENPGKHFSSAAHWEGQICVCTCNGCEVSGVLTQEQMIIDEQDSGHTWPLLSTHAQSSHLVNS